MVDKIYTVYRTRARIYAYPISSPLCSTRFVSVGRKLETKVRSERFKRVRATRGTNVSCVVARTSPPPFLFRSTDPQKLRGDLRKSVIASARLLLKTRQIAQAFASSYFFGHNGRVILLKDRFASRERNLESRPLIVLIEFSRTRFRSNFVISRFFPPRKCVSFEKFNFLSQHGGSFEIFGNVERQIKLN